MKNHIRLMAPLFYLAVVISAQKSQLFAFVGMENTHCEAPESVGNPKKDGVCAVCDNLVFDNDAIGKCF